MQIIDQEILDKTQSLKQRYFSHRRNKRQTKKRLLSGLIKCGGCGGSMTIVNRQRNSCSTKREKGTCDNPAGIQTERLEAQVIEGLKNILLDHDDLIKAFTSAFFEETVKLQQERNCQKQTNKRELEKVQLSTLLNDESSQQEAMTIIRSLIERIEITPGEKRGDPQVQLVGCLAAILELAVSKQQKTTIQSDSGFGRVLMVAGAGFEPATFRL